MRRKIAMIAVLGGLAAGLGCQHIGGKTDCGYNQADFPIAPVTTPYPTFPLIELPKEKAKDPIDPKAKTGSDADPKDKAKDKGNDGNN